MFCEVVELEFSKTINPKKDIELFFFPVFEKDHYYLVCFNTITDCGTIEVIDYSEGPRENKKLLKYLAGTLSHKHSRTQTHIHKRAHTHKHTKCLFILTYLF